MSKLSYTVLAMPISLIAASSPNAQTAQQKADAAALIAALEKGKADMWESSRQSTCTKYAKFPGKMLTFRRDKATPMSNFMK